MPAITKKQPSVPPNLNGIGSKLAAHSAEVAPAVEPLWTGPNGEGPNGGVTQGLLCRWLVCRERARIHLIEGLRTPEQFQKALHYGQMWHACEEALAAGSDHVGALVAYCKGLCRQFPLQQAEINRWFKTCQCQFPVYVDWWAKHPDVVVREPLLQETMFDVPYLLPSGRKVRLRGKWDSVDLINGKIWLQENKSKGTLDEELMQRMLRSGFEIQTMLYAVAICEQNDNQGYGEGLLKPLWRDVGSSNHVFGGVRYNVIRRPLSGGKGMIKQGEGKPSSRCEDCNGTGLTLKQGKPHSKCGGTGVIAGTPPETDDEFFGRLLDDYIAKEPEYFFMRWQVELRAGDVERFRRECLDPILENLIAWHEAVTTGRGAALTASCLNHRMPYGVYSSLMDGGITEVDRYADTGDKVGLERAEKLFPELEGE